MRCTVLRGAGLLWSWHPLRMKSPGYIYWRNQPLTQVIYWPFRRINWNGLTVTSLINKSKWRTDIASAGEANRVHRGITAARENTRSPRKPEWVLYWGFDWRTEHRRTERGFNKSPTDKQQSIGWGRRVKWRQKWRRKTVPTRDEPETKSELNCFLSAWHSASAQQLLNIEIVI